MKIPKTKEPEYPRVGQPLENYVIRKKKVVKTVYIGHIILSRSEGKFVEPEFDSESKCLEYSAELVVEMRKNGTNK